MDTHEDKPAVEQGKDEPLVLTVESRELIVTSMWPGISGGPEIRANQGKRMIGGLAAVFNKYSENLGGYVERVAPSFFNKSRADGWPGVVCRYNHNDLYLLGATRNGTLRLAIDETGLNYDVDLPESRNDVLEWVGRGDVGHSSFSFIVHEQEWGHTDQGFPMRTLVSGKLVDVAPVPVPAYRDSTVAMRSLAEAKEVPLEDVIELARSGELSKLFVVTGADGQPKPKPRAKPIPGAVARAKVLGMKPPEA